MNESNNLIIEQNRFNELLKCNIYFYSFMNYTKYFKNNDFNFEICYYYWSVDKIDLYNIRLSTVYNGQLLQPIKYLKKEHNCSIHIKDNYNNDEILEYNAIIDSKNKAIKAISESEIIIGLAEKDVNKKKIIYEYATEFNKNYQCYDPTSCDRLDEIRRNMHNIANQNKINAQTLADSARDLLTKSEQYITNVKHKHVVLIKNLNYLTITVEKAVKARSVALYQPYNVCKKIYSIMYKNDIFYENKYYFFPNLKRTIDFILEIIEYLEKEPNWSIDIKNNHENDLYLINSTNGLLEILKYFEKEHNWSIYIKNDKGNNVYKLSSYGNQLEIQRKHNYL